MKALGLFSLFDVCLTLRLTWGVALGFVPRRSDKIRVFDTPLGREWWIVLLILEHSKVTSWSMSTFGTVEKLASTDFTLLLIGVFVADVAAVASLRYLSVLVASSLAQGGTG